MKVSADFICEHEMPQPWATCTECMLLPRDMQPQPPAPTPPPKPAPKPRASRAKKADGTTAPKKRSSGPKTPTPHVSTRLPRTDTDKAPALFGDKDLAYEIPEANLTYHVKGPDSAWLPISSMPKELRPNGIVYLQVDSELLARCRVKGIGFRDRRWTHEAPGVTTDAGPGATLELFKDEWTFLSINLGPEGEVDVPGYRYLVPTADGPPRPWVEQS